MRRSRIIVGVAVLVLAGWGVKRLLVDDETDTEAVAHTRAPSRTAAPDFAQQLGAAAKRSGGLSFGDPNAPATPDGTISISGQVVDILDHQPVANVEVVFKSALGEETVTTRPDGTYRVAVMPGVYRAFVRDDSVLSVGIQDRVRLPAMPSPDVAGVPDEGLMPLVIASADVEHIDLSVTRGGTIDGEVVDNAGHAIEGAVLRARGNVIVRPVLGTDVAESDAKGTFTMRVPAGDYILDGTHAKFAGMANGSRVRVNAGGHAHASIVLTAGCVITGKVRLPDGKPASDGAIEKKWGQTDLEFGPAGRIEADGTFRWVTTDEVTIALRAWPWKSPPSNIRTFECRDGARFADVVFDLPSRSPDIEGVLLDHAGRPVPFTYVDLAPLDNGIGQQERTDAEGHWAVYAMPAGSYRVTASAVGAGVVDATVMSPQHGVELRLSGTGKIDGTTTLANGSFELNFDSCGDAAALPVSPRIVTVTNGRFHLDDAPACDLTVAATWHGHRTLATTHVDAGGSGTLDLALGPPHDKLVEGFVKDVTGKPLPNQIVTATLDDETATATTDDSGKFALKTFSGAQLFVATGDRMASAQVGFANVDREVVELVLDQEVDL